MSMATASMPSAHSRESASRNSSRVAASRPFHPQNAATALSGRQVINQGHVVMPFGARHLSTPR